MLTDADSFVLAVADTFVLAVVGGAFFSAFFSFFSPFLQFLRQIVSTQRICRKRFADVFGNYDKSCENALFVVNWTHTFPKSPGYPLPAAPSIRRFCLSMHQIYVKFPVNA